MTEHSETTDGNPGEPKPRSPFLRRDVAKRRLMGEPRPESPWLPDYPPMTMEEILAFIEGSHWTFTKMLLWPHEYTLRTKAKDEAKFEQFVMHIRKAGHEARWRGLRRIYFDVQHPDGLRRYWTKPAPLHRIILINRVLKG